MRFDTFGREIPDPTPMEVPHDWKRPLSLHEEIRRFVRSELSRQAEAQGEESFEEADDFDVDEDPDPLSPYEIPEAPIEALGGVRDEDAAPPLDPKGKAAVESPSAPEGPSKG